MSRVGKVFFVFVCMYTFMRLCTCMWWPEVGGGVLFRHRAPSFFETGSLTELEAVLADQQLQDPPVSASPALG